MSLDLGAIEVLDAIERKGSFAAAANELDRVPSAVTYVVRKLEEDLGILLFDRRGHRAVLTEAGRELLLQGRDLLLSADQLERRVKRVASGWEVELRIAVDGILRMDAMLALVAEFLKNEPATRIRISNEVLGGTLDALLSGRADLALGTALHARQDDDAGEFKSRVLGHFDMVFVVAPSHPLAGADKPLSRAQIRAHRAIAVGDTSRNLPPITVGLLHGQDVLTLPTMADKLLAQIAGLGCGYLPRALIEPHVREKRLVIKDTADSASPRRTLHYSWNSDASGNAMRWFLSRLEDQALRRRLMP
jgi:DNA-binding transcriptional LysR family regulator